MAQQQSSAKKVKGDFEFIKAIGEGSFSTVHLVKDKKTGASFAIKECDKSQIIREKKVKYIHLEKRILTEYLNDHPFFIKLAFTFHDDESLYFGLSYCPNGDLLSFIKKYPNGEFPLAKATFYAAEIVEALQHMHRKQIVHRDLKPENILLDENMHIKLTDFGTARILTDPDDTPAPGAAASTQDASPAEQDAAEQERIEQRRRPRRSSFVGTAQFVSPEILQGKVPHIGCDLWALGCIVFQMINGRHLFTGGHEYDIFQKVIRVSFAIPDDFPAAACDLIKKLVVAEPDKRLGASETQGYDQLKAHEFFQAISWANLPEQTPP